MTTPYEVRAVENDRSRNRAEHHKEPWSMTELELLLQWDGSHDELALTAELLGRTIEACRQQFYISRKEGIHVRRTTTRRSVETVVEEVHVTRPRWSPEDDEEWPAEWYIR